MTRNISYGAWFKKQTPKQKHTTAPAKTLASSRKRVSKPDSEYVRSEYSNGKRSVLIKHYVSAETLFIGRANCSYEHFEEHILGHKFEERRL